MSHPNYIKWPGSAPRFPILLQRAESTCDVIDAALPPQSADVQALLDGMYPELSRRPGRTRHLMLLTRRHHLLAFTRQLVVHQMSLMGFMNGVIGLLEQSPPIPSILPSVCHRLRDLTSHRPRGDPRRYPSTGDPRLYTAMGDPRLYPSTGDPRLYTAMGDPRLYPSTGDPRLYPSTGDPRLYPSTGDPRLYTAMGDPRLYPSTGDPRLYPSTDDPRLYPSKSDPRMYPSMGDTRLYNASSTSDPRLYPASSTGDPTSSTGDPTSSTGDPRLYPASSMGYPCLYPASSMGYPCLYPASSTGDPTSDIHDVLLLMAIKAALLTERFILHVLRRVARVPAEVTTDLLLSLTVYNQVVTDISRTSGPSAELRPFCLSRTMKILAEERGRMMAEELCRLWSRSGLEDVLRREMETLQNPPTHPALRPSNSLQKKSHVTPSQRSPGSLEVLVQVNRSQVTPVLQRSQVTPGQRSSTGSLGVLVQEDRSQMTPVLQILIGLDKKTWSQVPGSSETALYSQYCSRLWPALYSHVFHALCPGMRGPGVLPALPSLPEGACLSAIHLLQDTLMSDDLPEPCVSLGRSLCQRLLCIRSLSAWDSALCQALSSALSDKCSASTLPGGDAVSGSHSRTCGILVTLCQRLSELLESPMWSQRSPDPRNLSDRSDVCAVTGQQGVLTRSTLSLHLCDMWLRSRTQSFLSTGSLRQLVLITHGDLPVIKAQCRSLVAAAENASRLPSNQISFLKIKRSRDVLEGLVVSLPHVLSSVCSRRAQDFFQHTMPAGRHWRGKLVTGPDLAPSDYAQAAVSAVLVPVLDGVNSLCPEDQVSAVCATLSVFMEAWMGHILREKIKFSLQGALQLRRDFECVREVLRSRESRVSPEVVLAALALPVFSQADNAIVCLLQQPSRKTYLQTGGCVVFSCCPHVCRVAVDTMSDSLQSLDSLERRVWDGEISGRLPRHNHDSYLPHNQRQWLSLRLHNTWGGLSLPWGGREVSEG
ncbi:coiled-coil domain-containing protein 142 [Mantella aurantiaca]